ncbi:hypothetical protein [Microbacterium sp. 179-I 3D4 NHS]|uniref:hypothetical protein n=1 Tax=Microbacterium sp. 179-I 3D4 NHS TaxID=3142381 RepID=UPI0039A35BBA
MLDLPGIPRALLGGTAAFRRHLDWDRAIRTPVASVRRIGVVHLVGEAGATMLTHELVRAAVRRRQGPVLAVDLSETGRLAGRLGVVGTTEVRGRRLIRTSAEAEAALQRIGPRVWGARPHPGGGVADAWSRHIAPVMRFHEIAMVDLGRRDPERDLEAAAALCDGVCVVAPAERRAAEAARVVAEAVAAMPEHPSTVLALVDREGTARGVPRTIRAHTGLPLVQVPRDAGLAHGGVARSLAARQAMLQLAALLIAAPSTEEDAA